MSSKKKHQVVVYVISEKFEFEVVNESLAKARPLSNRRRSYDVEALIEILFVMLSGVSSAGSEAPEHCFATGVPK